MLFPSRVIRDRAIMYQADNNPMTTLRTATSRRDEATDVTQRDFDQPPRTSTAPDRHFPTNDFLRNTPAIAWIAGTAAELHWGYDAYTLDWFPPRSMLARG